MFHTRIYIHFVGIDLKRLAKTLLMSTHNKSFHVEARKISILFVKKKKKKKNFPGAFQYNSFGNS